MNLNDENIDLSLLMQPLSSQPLPSQPLPSQPLPLQPMLSKPLTEDNAIMHELNNNYNNNDSSAKIDMKTIYDNIRLNNYNQLPSKFAELMKSVRDTLDPNVSSLLTKGSLPSTPAVTTPRTTDTFVQTNFEPVTDMDLEIKSKMDIDNEDPGINSNIESETDSNRQMINLIVEPSVEPEIVQKINSKIDDQKINRGIDDQKINPEIEPMANPEIGPMTSPEVAIGSHEPGTGCMISNTYYPEIDLSDPLTYPDSADTFYHNKNLVLKVELTDHEQKEMHQDITESVYLAKTFLCNIESDSDTSNVSDSDTSNSFDNLTNDLSVSLSNNQTNKQLIDVSPKIDQFPATSESVSTLPIIPPLKHINSYTNINLGRFGGFGGFGEMISNMITTSASVVASTINISGSEFKNNVGSDELESINMSESINNVYPVAWPVHTTPIPLTTINENNPSKTTNMTDTTNTTNMTLSTNSLNKSDNTMQPATYNNTNFVKMLDRRPSIDEKSKGSEFFDELPVQQSLVQGSSIHQSAQPVPTQILSVPLIQPNKSSSDKSLSDPWLKQQRTSQKDKIDPIDMIAKLDKNPTAYEEIKKTTDELQKKTIESRRISKWVEDASDTKCFNCHAEFSMLCRRHHCRLCGRLFCSVCSNYSVVLPHEILNKLPNKPQTYMDMIWKDTKKDAKVCKNCYTYTNQILMVRKIIKIFEACQLTLGELNTLGSYSPVWKNAANFIMAKFREIQYKLSIEDLTIQEKRMLWINRNHLSGHSRWMVQLIKATNLNNQYARSILEKLIKKHRKNRCRDLMCTRFCSNTIRITDMLDLIRYNDNYPVISDIVRQCLIEINPNNLIHYLPFLVFNIKNNNFILAILLEKGKNDFVFMNNLYWCIKVYCPDDEIRMANMVRALNFIQENTSKKFRRRFKKMLMMEKLDVKSVHLLNDTGDDIVLPVCSHITFKKVDPNIKIVDSNSQPAIINFIDENQVPKPIMFKNDDVRKDYIVLNIINIIRDILKNEEDLEIDIVKYEVIPTSKTTGYIEIVEDSATIFHITQRSELTNYILNNNGNILIKSFRDKFIKSTALYCVLSYLLGIGDRHLNNIMVTKTGLLFHIDFGFILGQDPKYSNRLIRLNPDIISVLGGYDSDDYVYFRKVCVKIYNRMRLHVNLFSSLLSIIPSVEPTIGLDVIKRELTERFEIGENCLEAATHMDNKVASGSNLEYWIIDTLYKSTQSGIFKGVAYVAGSFLSMFKNK